MVNYFEADSKRNFQLIVGEKTFYVNAHYLATLSPYFDSLFFSCFKESADQKVTLYDEDPIELEILFKYMCPSDDYTYNKTLNEDNLPILVFYSAKYLIPELKKEIVHFFYNQFDEKCKSISYDKSLQILIECIHANYSQSDCWAICKSVGRHGEEKIRKTMKDLPNELVESVIKYARGHFYLLTESQSPFITKGRTHQWGVDNLYLFL
uniref:BTB domain-containing protein n=1 Tax=Parastrongyloides trichosuri TaxID=131310 RepID=A0A0N4ZJW5_PARTI